jgi:hypothetical protein
MTFRFESHPGAAALICFFGEAILLSCGIGPRKDSDLLDPEILNEPRVPRLEPRKTFSVMGIACSSSVQVT